MDGQEPLDQVPFRITTQALQDSDIEVFEVNGSDRSARRYTTISIDDYSELRPTRQARNIYLTAFAEHFGVCPTDTSRNSAPAPR